MNAFLLALKKVNLGFGLMGFGKFVQSDCHLFHNLNYINLSEWLSVLSWLSRLSKWMFGRKCLIDVVSLIISVAQAYLLQ